MSYFATWDYRTYAPNVLRKNTRIYWSDKNHIESQGRCVGTFVGENPGAAHGAGRASGWDRLVEENSVRPGDKTLRFIRDVWVAAVNFARRLPDDDDYVEVLNLYYFRCPKAGQQLTT